MCKRKSCICRSKSDSGSTSRCLSRYQGSTGARHPSLQLWQLLGLCAWMNGTMLCRWLDDCCRPIKLLLHAMGGANNHFLVSAVNELEASALRRWWPWCNNAQRLKVSA